MKKLIALALCLAMALGLMAGCSQEKADSGIVGTWDAQLDCSEAVEAMLKAQLGDIAASVEVEDLTVQASIVFHKDGNYRITVTDDTKDMLYNKMVDIFSELLQAYLGLDMPMEALVEQYMTREQMDEFVDELPSAGKYTYQDGKLTLDDLALDCSIQGNTMTWDTQDPDLKDFFPVTLKRV